MLADFYCTHRWIVVLPCFDHCFNWCHSNHDGRNFNNRAPAALFDPPSGAPYPYGKQKETHFLMVIMASDIARGRLSHNGDDDGVTQHGSYNWNNSLTETCNFGLLCTSLILDVRVMINWHLSIQGIRWPISRDHIAGSSLQLIEVTCFISWPLIKCWFFIASRAHVWLTCWIQGRRGQKRAELLKPNCNFFLSKCFLLLCSVSTVFIDYLNSKQKAEQFSENLTSKLKNSNQNSTFSWISFIGLWKSRPRSYAFRLA